LLTLLLQDFLYFKDVVFEVLLMKGFLQWRFWVCWFELGYMEYLVFSGVGGQLYSIVDRPCLPFNQERSDFDVIELLRASFCTKVFCKHVDSIPPL
jgi:hypothetical protein